MTLCNYCLMPIENVATDVAYRVLDGVLRVFHPACDRARELGGRVPGPSAKANEQPRCIRCDRVLPDKQGWCSFCVQRDEALMDIGLVQAAAVVLQTYVAKEFSGRLSRAVERLQAFVVAQP